MSILSIPPWFPALFWLHPYTPLVPHPPIPARPVIHNFMPSKASWIKKKRCKQPSHCHKPCWVSDHDMYHSAHIRSPKNVVDYQKEDQLKSFDEVASWIQLIVFSKTCVENYKFTPCWLVFSTPMENSTAIIVCLCPKGECEENRSQLQLHEDKITQSCTETLFQA